MRYHAWLVLCMAVLSGCGGTKKVSPILDSASAQSDQNSCDIALVYKEQSRKEAALSAIRRTVVDDNQSIADDDTVRRLEARAIDLAIPLGAVPLEQYIDCTEEGDFCLAYTSDMMLPALNDFFHKEMERLGWQKKAQYDQYEQLLVYEKPTKIVIISLRPVLKKSAITTFFIFQMHIE